MPPKATRQQNAPTSSEPRAPADRRQAAPKRVQTRASMSTEYQERFLPPHCHTTVISTTTLKDPYHPLKATGTDVATFRSYYVTHKWSKNPPKAPQASTQPKAQQRCSSAPHNLLRFAENQMPSRVEDYTSVYKNDFQAWKANKRQPFKLSNSLKVNQGLVIPNNATKEGRPPKDSSKAAAGSKAAPQARQPQPFASVTSYRSDYVTHPVQPRVRKEKPAYQPIKSLPSEPEVPSRPKVAWEINQALVDGASEFLTQFKSWSFMTKFQGQGKAKETSSAEDHDVFLSTTHADYTVHKCERTKPVLPSVQHSEKSKEPLQATTTMREDYKAWDVPRRFPAGHAEKQDSPKKNSFSLCTEEPKPKPLNQNPQVKETPVCNPSSTATQEHQSPGENGTFSGFECISNGSEEARRYWSTCLDRRMAWPDGDVSEEPTESQHIISCMVSSRN